MFDDVAINGVLARETVEEVLDVLGETIDLSEMSSDGSEEAELFISRLNSAYAFLSESLGYDFVSPVSESIDG